MKESNTDHRKTGIAFEKSRQSHMKRPEISTRVEEITDDVENFVQTNPMMDRIRSTLKDQLLQTRDRVKAELLEQEQALKESKRAREDAGIELYGVQQQLSRLQSGLTTIDKRYSTVSEERIESQQKLMEAKQKYAKKLSGVEDLRKDASKGQEVLNALVEKIRQAKRYNESIKSEVAVTRTVANKTKDDFKVRAKDKLTQDTYIDSLNTQVGRLEDEILLTDAQLRAQKEQSTDANKMIRETSGALDKLASEQRRLVQQWNSSVVALGRRDQALSAARNALRKVRDSIKDLESENARLNRDIESLQENKNSLKMTKDRLDNEVVFTETTILKVQSNLGALSEKFEILSEALHNTNQEEKSAESAMSKIESEISAVNHKCELLIRERHAVEEKIANARHDQISMSKAAQNLAKEEKSILSEIHGKEIESAIILNEIARLDIDRLNTQAHNIQLEEKLKEEAANLREVEAQIDSLEGEVKRCNDEIEKKTKRVAKLNLEYNKMVDACDEEEPLGPLESTIKSLSVEIEQECSEIRGLQKEWLTRQTELIKTISKTNSIQEKDSEMTTRLSILRSKSLRLLQEIHTNEASLKSIEYTTRGLHTDITRLNDLIEQNTRRRTDYANKIAVNMMEFERELVELEEQSSRLENQISEVKSNKTKMLRDTEDLEGQIQIWEKKIQLEKDTQVALHTSKDAVDIKGMEKEIKRMKHRLDTLIRIQEQLLRDMELAINKREDIAVKYKNTKFGGNDSQQTMTKGALAKKLELAKVHLKKMEFNIQEATLIVNKTRKDLDTVRLVLSNKNDECDSIVNLTKSLQEEIDTKEFEFNRLRSLCELQDELLKRYDALSKGDVPPVQVSARAEFEVEKQLVTAKSRMEKVTNIITGLALRFDHYEDVFDRMNVLASDVLTPL